MGACFSKGKGEASQKLPEPVPQTPPNSNHAEAQPLDGEKSDRVSPTEGSESTTVTTSEEPPKKGIVTNGTNVLVVGNDLSSSQSILDSNDGEESLSGSPSQKKQMPRKTSLRKTVLPSIFSDYSGAKEAQAEQANQRLSLDRPEWTKWTPSHPYKPPVIGDSVTERARVSALKRLGIDYTSQEPSLDFITKLITNVCGCTAASISLIDDTTCHVKSLSGTTSPVTKFDRRLAISLHCIVPLKPEVLVAENLTLDTRFKDHPLVTGPPYLRFVAAAPLLDSAGNRIGALTIHDYKPRRFDAESCNVLCNFAEMTMRELQRIAESGFQRAMSWTPAPGDEQMLRKMDACSDGVVLLDVRLGRWPILFSNDGWSNVTGLAPVSGSLKNFWDLFQLPGVSASRQPWSVYETSVERGETFTLDVILAGSSGKQLFAVTFKPATEDLDEGMVSINVPSRVASSHVGPHDQNFYFGTIFRGRQGSLSRSASSSLPHPPPSPTPEDELKPPIPNVRLGPLLGKGSFGSVHYGTWNGAQIAVKVIQHMATEAERQARDEQLEAILGLKMLHPNIVRTFQFATKDRSGSRPGAMTERLRMDMQFPPDEDKTPPQGLRKMMETWIILELCNRGSLQEAIDKGAFRIKAGEINEGTPNMINILRTATEIAGAMSYLHSLDILHSDLNGNNILLISNTGIDDRPFSVKVSDFGLSRIHIGERTVATQTYGTVTHMPPELLAEGRLSKAADVYAFGVLLWEMLTGQRPWAGLRHVQIITRKMQSGTQLKWPADVFKPFRDLAQTCMHPDPHQRPPFSQVLEQLEPMRELAEQGRLAEYVPEPSGFNGVSASLGVIGQIEEGEELSQYSSKELQL